MVFGGVRSRARSPYSHHRPRRLFNPALDRGTLAWLRPSRPPKIKIQTRRLLSSSPFKRRPSIPATSPPNGHHQLLPQPSHLLSFNTMADDAQVRDPSWHPAYAFTPPYRLHRLPSPDAPSQASKPSFARCHRASTNMTGRSMSTPSRAPMPVPPLPTPCSALL